MTNPDGPDLAPAERVAWLKNVINAAESAAADLRARNDATQAVLIDDLDDLCVRLRAELDDVK